MIPLDKDELVQSFISSTKASISVILVLAYGYALKRKKFVTDDGESNISKLGTSVFLPALLFSEIGPLATRENLTKYFYIIPFTLSIQFLSYLFASVAHRLFKMPQHFVPLFIFNNVTSLPLLLLSTLNDSGAFDAFYPTDDAALKHRLLESAIQHGRVYILINALVGSLTRFSFGPYLMQDHHEAAWTAPHADDPASIAKLSVSSRIHLNDDVEEAIASSEVVPSLPLDGKTAVFLRKLAAFFNPPLVGGLVALFVGLIPLLHDTVYLPSGLLSPIGNSIKSIGELYTALQMFVLGAHLYTQNKTSFVPFSTALYVFVYRYVISGALSIGLVYMLRMQYDALPHDPMLLFVLCISNVGPPALTLSAVADLAHIPPEREGEISQMIFMAYITAPAIAFAVSAAIGIVSAFV